MTANLIYQGKDGGLFESRRVVAQSEMRMVELHWGLEQGIPRSLGFTAGEARRTAAALLEAADLIEAGSDMCACGEPVPRDSDMCVACTIEVGRARRRNIRAVL